MNAVFSSKELAVFQAQAYVLLQCGKADAAYTLFKALLRMHPNEVAVLPGVAICALRAGDYEVATNTCQQLLQMAEHQHNSQLWLCLSRSLWHQEEPDLARKAYSNFLHHQHNLHNQNQATAVRPEFEDVLRVDE